MTGLNVGLYCQNSPQLNIPSTVVHMKNDYFQDSVSTLAVEERTRQQYQKRGLMQGCNHSAMLFILYLSKLSRRTRLSGVGASLPSGDLLYILLFADDIIILSSSATDLEVL